MDDQSDESVGDQHFPVFAGCRRRLWLLDVALLNETERRDLLPNDSNLSPPPLPQPLSPAFVCRFL